MPDTYKAELGKRMPKEFTKVRDTRLGIEGHVSDVREGRYEQIIIEVCYGPTQKRTYDYWGDLIFWDKDGT